MLIEKILKSPQNILKQQLAKDLNRIGYTPLLNKGFIYAKGTIPVLLVAHLDTVHKHMPEIICYSHNNRILMSPNGIGGDDRCGVYMIMEIAKTHKCHILFTEDEECGGIGATAFVDSDIKPDVNYIIEFDRKGSNDAIFYNDSNEEFQKYITSFGFKTEFGSFSDISIIAPRLGISAVNLSSGYYNPHSKSEYIDILVVRKNIERAKNIVATKTDKFKYVEDKKYANFDLFDYGFGLDEQELMNIEEGYIVTNIGDMLDGDNFFIDKNNTVYEYDWEYGFATPIEANAFNTLGMPLKFNAKKAEAILII
jgi:hypothetical protein